MSFLVFPFSLINLILSSIFYQYQCFYVSEFVLDVLQVDLTEYMEKHEFVFDAVLNEEVSNDEVCILLLNE